MSASGRRGRSRRQKCTGRGAPIEKHADRELASRQFRAATSAGVLADVHKGEGFQSRGKIGTSRRIETRSKRGSSSQGMMPGTNILEGARVAREKL